MRYFSETNIFELGINWSNIIEAIKDATHLLKEKDFSQPVKPYLRYRDLKNRIIAMPAFIGGEFDVSGIKWIASFPDNIHNGIARAHSTIILNEANTGKPKAIFNTALVSAIRTAAVTGSVISDYIEKNDITSKMNFGIIGFGPIGKQHLDLIINLYGDKIENIYLYDLRPINMDDIPEAFQSKVIITNGWEEVFDSSDIFMTCTVSKNRYINKKAKKPGLYLNVSLRDFDAPFMKEVDVMVVDDWEEVNRENTDIEFMHLKHGLEEKNVHTIVDVLCNNKLANSLGKVVMFNPMGMAVYDMAVCSYFFNLAESKNVGVLLED
ncbi:2,3-diaminopropionate biosynthesis protein SbnB [uncultured Kordia sp.]|uniref:2,3-diaminopropionate biosynthesis protein SbnB n=1 Tax=uncultured Kordia sp. TaxID=507699 RepID=UPI002636516F|nr:2,3-diaminopropionate biosynthesis protein SbnB [uncultured Kordia sp.]